MRKWPTAKRDASCTENSSACNTASGFRCCGPSKSVCSFVWIHCTVHGSFDGFGKLRCVASYDALCNRRLSTILLPFPRLQVLRRLTNVVVGVFGDTASSFNLLLLTGAILRLVMCVL